MITVHLWREQINPWFLAVKQPLSGFQPFITASGYVIYLYTKTVLVCTYYSDVQHALCCAESEVRVYSALDSNSLDGKMLVCCCPLATFDLLQPIDFSVCRLEVGSFAYIIFFIWLLYLYFRSQINRCHFVNITVLLTIEVMIFESHPEGLGEFQMGFSVNSALLC